MALSAAASAIIPSTSIAAFQAALSTILVTTPDVMFAEQGAAALAGSPDGPNGPHQSGECELMGSFALLVQAALGGLALLSLVYKRWRERPQRPLKIWFFDASKQVFGSVLVHIANVFMSILTSGRLDIKMDPPHRLKMRDDYVPNPCSFYLLNLAIDTTAGIPILLLLLRIFTSLANKTAWGDPPASIQSGNYGSPPRAWWWLKQSVIYFCGLFGMKLVVLFIFIILPWISRVGDWALGWTEGNEKLQIVFVMMLFPVIMNAVQYYIIDSFIKKQSAQQQQDQLEGGESLPGADPDVGAGHHAQGGARRGGRRSYDASTGLLSPAGGHDDVVSDDQDTVKMKRPRVRDLERKHSEYSPDVDGDTSTTVLGSSSSTSGERGKVLPSELFPRE